MICLEENVSKQTTYRKQNDKVQQKSKLEEARHFHKKIYYLPTGTKTYINIYCFNTETNGSIFAEDGGQSLD